MEQQTTSTARVALKWGIIAGIVSIVWMAVMYVGDLTQMKWLNFSISSIISIGLLVLSMNDFKSQNNTYMSLGQAIGLGTMQSAISMILALTFDNIYKLFIDTTLNQRLSDAEISKLEAEGAPEQSIEAAKMGAEWVMNHPGIMFIISIVLGILIGFVLSLIVGLFLKKDKPVFD